MSLTVAFSTRRINSSYVQHIKKTCGVKNLEILPFENPDGTSLTEIYNKALSQAKNDVVVLCHDDISFNAKGWGRKLLDRYNESDYGILGVAGTTHMASTGRWWQDTTKMVGRVSHTHEGKTWVNSYSSTFPKQILKVCCLDGVFFSCHKKRIVNNFDEGVEGFHFYDVDFCFSNFISGVKLGVVFDVKITHKSIGQTNDEWEENRKNFVKKFSVNPKTKEPLLPTYVKPEIKFTEVKKSLKDTPKVELIIPNKNNFKLLKGCIDSIINISTYENYKITVADTGSDEDNLKQIREYCNENKVKLIEFEFYHFAGTNNDVVKNHCDKDTELLLFCNNDIELINDAITEMVNLYVKNKKTCGTVGARLHFEDNTIQHGGIMLMGQPQKDGQMQIGLSHQGLRSSYNYPISNLIDTLGNTGAFLLVKRSLFEEIGMFNEQYSDCLEDVELNMECIVRGRKNMFAGNAVAYHFESRTRKSEGAIKPEDFNHLMKFVNENNKKLIKYIKLRQ